MEAKLIKTEKENYVLVDPAKGTYDDGYMLGTSRESQYNKLSIKNCQAIERRYDIYELAKENYHKFWSIIDESGLINHTFGYVEGFQKALELNNAKLYTLEDMMNCWNKALTFQNHKETLGEYIKSLKQTEWEVEIELEPYHDGKFVDDGKTHSFEPKWRPKFDADGCLILKILI